MADQQQAAPKKKKLLNGTNIEYRYPSGSVYVGGFKDGKLHGFGVYKYHPSGDEYEGEWLTDMKHGHGTYTYDGGDRYVGEWRAGKKFGKGTYVFTTGDEYIGHWKEDKIHGFGTFTIARNGNKYEGNWEESYRHGHGILLSGNGDCYDGDWQRGKEEGMGILKYANGNAYIGAWKGGQMDGKGIFVEKNQKHTVEHIAGYLITKTEIDENTTVDADWQAADRLYHTFKRKLEQNGGVDITGGAGQASSADLIKSNMEREQWKKRYEDLLQQKTSALTKDAGNDVNALKEQIAALKLANNAEAKRADDAASRSKLLEAELKETRQKAEASGGGGGGGGGAASGQEVEDLRRQVGELTKELELRRPKGGSDDDPVELKVKLELAEGELRNLRETREQVYKLREQNMDGMRNIQRLEQRNEELLKEMNVLRARSSNLQGQIAEDQSKQYNELSADIRKLQDELAATNKAKAESDEKLNRAKRLEEMNSLKVKRVDELEDENKRLRSGRMTDSDLNKNLDKKSEQLDSLRRQNADLQRQVDELQYDLNMAGAGGAQNGESPGGKKDKKKKGDTAAVAPEVAVDADAIKKEKKKLKKAVAERDALAQELYEEQVTSTRLSRAFESMRGRVAVVASLYGGTVGEEANPSQPIRINLDNPAELITEGGPPAMHTNNDDDDGGKKKKKKNSGKSNGIEFDACVEGPDAAKDAFVEMQRSVTMAVDGFHTSVISMGPMTSGKSKMITGMTPLILKSLFAAIDEQNNNALASFNTKVRVSVLEASNGGLFDLASGSEIMKVMRNSDTLESVAVGELLTEVSSAKDATKKLEELKSKRRGGVDGRSHLFMRISFESRHKVLNIVKSGKVSIVDLCGQGSLGDQKDVESGKYVNQTSTTVVSVLENLIGAVGHGTSATMPYDSSPFGMLLADVLGGNCMTNIIACVNAINTETINDSVATLQLASRARQIINRPVLQMHQTPDVLRMRALITESMSSEQATQNLEDVPNSRM